MEVATDAALFDGRRLVSEHTFFSSWFGNSLVPGRQLRSVHGYALYQVPDVVWDRLRQEFLTGRANRLYYRVRQAAVAAEIMSAGASSTHAFME